MTIPGWSRGFSLTDVLIVNHNHSKRMIADPSILRTADPICWIVNHNQSNRMIADPSEPNRSKLFSRILEKRYCNRQPPRV